MKKISVLTVTSGRPKNLTAFLKSLVRTQGFQTAEVLILVNGPCEDSRKIIKRFACAHANIDSIQLLRVQGRGRARNILLRQASGEIVYFLDDDVVVEQNLFSVLNKALTDNPKVDIFGGPNLTPGKRGIVQQAQGIVLGSFFGTLWMSRRYIRKGEPLEANERILILCNLALRKKVFYESAIVFNEALFCAEENVLLQQLAQRGHKAMHIPELAVYHERRKNFQQFARQIFVYGRGRAQAVKYLPQLANFIYFIPSLFVLYTAAGLFIRFPGYFLPLYTYILIVFIHSFAISWQKKNIIFLPVLSVVFPLLHLAYGAGFFWEFLNTKNTIKDNTDSTVYLSAYRKIPPGKRQVLLNE